MTPDIPARVHGSPRALAWYSSPECFQETFGVATCAEMVLPPRIGGEYGGARTETCERREGASDVGSHQRKMTRREERGLRVGEDVERSVIVTCGFITPSRGLRRAAREQVSVER